MNKLYFLIGAFSLFFLSCSKEKTSQDHELYVKVDTVKTNDTQGLMLFPGKVKPAEDVSIAFRVSGTIQRFHVKVGSYVHKGQLLVEMDPRDYELQLSATEAEYKQVKAEAERVMALYSDNSTTANNNDKAVYGLQQITAKYNNHKNQLADTKLYAPFDGYVQSLLFDEHETVGAGMPVLAIINNSTPEVEINVPASTYMQRDQMDSYSCSFDVFPNETFPLSFICVNQKANANQLYTMRLKLGNSSSGKKPAAGMATMVKITSRQSASSQLIVPVTALFQEKGKSYVFVVKNNVLEKREVLVHEFKSNGTAIINSGIAVNDVVVSAGTRHVHDKDKVKVLPAPSPTNVGGLL